VLIVTWFSDDGRGINQADVGEITVDQILESLRHMLASKSVFKAAEYSLVDLTQVPSMKVAVDEWRAIAAVDGMLAELNPNLFVALVAPRATVFRPIRMWEVFIGPTGWQTQVFRSPGEAEQWLQTKVPGFDLKSPGLKQVCFQSDRLAPVRWAPERWGTHSPFIYRPSHRQGLRPGNKVTVSESHR
jgi:hypothetical protein